MKTAIKRENGEFLVISLKHVRVFSRHANPAEPKNCGQKLMKMTIKHENDEFLGITLKHVPGLKVALISPRTIKMWAIAHENGHKTRKRRVYGHIFPTCIRSEGHGKSP